MNEADLRVFWSRVDVRGPDECWPWRNATPGQYGTMWLPSERRARPAHVIAWVSKNGPLPDGMQACHRCDNRPCCNPDHLFPGTQSDNIQDAMKKGRFKPPWTDYERIEADPRQRPGLRREELILAVTNAISEELERQGVTQAELARRLDTTRGHVSQILAGGRNLTLATIAEVADALGCRVEVRLAAPTTVARATKGRAARTARAAHRAR